MRVCVGKREGELERVREKERERERDTDVEKQIERDVDDKRGRQNVRESGK